MYFENRRLEECTHAVQIVANLHVPQNRPVGFGLRNYTIRESTKSNNIPDPNPMPIKDGLKVKQMIFLKLNQGCLPEVQKYNAVIAVQQEDAANASRMCNRHKRRLLGRRWM